MDQTLISNQANIIKTERQIKLLKTKIQELTTENQILREINVKLQIENFNLQKKLECKQLEEELIINDQRENEKPELELDDDERPPEIFEVVYENENDADINNEEYLEQDETVYEVQEEILKDLQEEVTYSNSNKHLKRRYSDICEEKEAYEEEQTIKKENIHFHIVNYTGSEESIVLEDETDVTETENTQDSSKQAMNFIYKLATKRSMLEKLKSIEKGKHKDSAFVSRVLEILFDKITLANSTAQGQKCQSKLHLPAKPALDQSKMDLCMKAFLHRLREEEINENELQSRIRSFNKLVNFKIQNCRKCLTRTEASKLLET